MQAIEDDNDKISPYEEKCRLSRWLVSFSTGPGWYPVGEFIALDAEAAIVRAIEVLGPGTAYQAEEIPWDSLPCPRRSCRAHD